MSGAFESMLAGGHPNSLGRTEEVVAEVLAEATRFEELFACYRSDDEVVRLRTSSAMKRLAQQRPDLLAPHLDRFIDEVGALDQASAQWTLAILFDLLRNRMTGNQEPRALALMQRNLARHTDWIVLNTTMEVLFGWSDGNVDLAGWLRPHLERLAGDARKSVSRRAGKYLAALDAR